VPGQDRTERQTITFAKEWGNNARPLPRQAAYILCPPKRPLRSKDDSPLAHVIPRAIASRHRSPAFVGLALPPHPWHQLQVTTAQAGDMNLLGFEAMAVGDSGSLGTIRVDRQGALTFAAAYDPQPFHLDEAAGAASPLGGLAASGWHTAGLVMRLIADNFLARHKSMGSPGVRDLRWIKPVLVGDHLEADYMVVGIRPSSRGDRGYVEVRFSAHTPPGDEVFSMMATLMIGR
jgi:acyl dehydratase